MMNHVLLPIAVSILACTVGCMEHTTSSGFSRIEIVSSEKMQPARDRATSRLKPGPGDYDKWERLHESVKSVLDNYGTVSWDPDPLPDFYFSGDWFHENSDAFGVSSSGSITKELLQRLPRVLAAHHKDAMLQMSGFEEPIEGLEILVTSSDVLVGWEGLDRDACKQRLREVGVMLD